METGTRCKLDDLIERQILIAVDASENSKRAVQFVGDFFGCYPGIKVLLLNIILEPASGYFENESNREKWKMAEQEKSKQMLTGYRQLLIDSDFPSNNVHTIISCKQGPSIADCILKEQAKLQCCTLVIGRRGISKKEEFIFGSTSNKILHQAKNCAVLVIE